MVLSSLALTRLQKCQHVLTLYKKKFPRLSTYTLHVTKRQNILGCTQFKNKRIYLRAEFLDLGSWKKIKDTLLHEIGHALDVTTHNILKKRGGFHGASWKAIGKIIGYDTTVLNNFFVSYNTTLKLNDYSKKNIIRKLNEKYC